MENGKNWESDLSSKPWRASELNGWNGPGWARRCWSNRCDRRRLTALVTATPCPDCRCPFGTWVSGTFRWWGFGRLCPGSLPACFGWFLVHPDARSRASPAHFSAKKKKLYIKFIHRVYPFHLSNSHQQVMLGSLDQFRRSFTAPLIGLFHTSDILQKILKIQKNPSRIGIEFQYQFDSIINDRLCGLFDCFWFICASSVDWIAVKNQETVPKILSVCSTYDRSAIFDPSKQTAKIKTSQVI